MSSHRSALIALALAGIVIGCRRDRDRAETRSANAATDARRAQAEPAASSAPAATVVPRRHAETNDQSPVTTTPVPPPAPRQSPPVVIVQQPPAPPPPPPATVVIVQQPPAPNGAQAAPIVASPYAPTVPGYTNDAGIMVPVVPLNIDPGAPPGAPGNGAPQPSTIGGG